MWAPTFPSVVEQRCLFSTGQQLTNRPYCLQKKTAAKPGVGKALLETARLQSTAICLLNSWPAAIKLACSHAKPHQVLQVLWAGKLCNALVPDNKVVEVQSGELLQRCARIQAMKVAGRCNQCVKTRQGRQLRKRGGKGGSGIGGM